MAQIIVFGASLTYGAWDIEGGWVQRLRKFLDIRLLKENKYYLTYNLGVSGDTSTEILERFDREIKARIDSDKETIILFCFGNNDSIIINKEKNNKTSKQKFEQDIISLIEKAKKYSNKIIFMSPPPADETKVNPIPWLKEGSYLNHEIETYGKIMGKISTKHKTFYFNLYNELIKTNYISTLDDGIHPNDKGHEQIFTLIKRFLEKNKII